MTEPASTSVAVGCGGGGGELGYGGGYRTPFTAIQLQELNHQALIFKYLLAGLPVPPDLVMPIRRSFEALSARFFPHPSLGYSSYYGKKFDPEPGRCRRTDGKKWRCSKEAHPDSKYCERHMHRGRNRSRKPVESQSASHLSNNNNNNHNGSFQNIPMYSVPGSEGSASFGINMTKKLHVEPTSYETTSHNNEFRSTVHDQHALSPEASGSLVGGLRLSSDNTGSGTWRLASSQDNVATRHGFDDMLSKQIHQQQSVHPFFSEWPVAKESWSSLDDGSNKNVFSSTLLSISIPRSSSDFSSRNGHSEFN